MRDIGKNIKILRTKQNMTQEELAEKLFVTRQTVSNYETGRSRPDVEMLAKIAEVLDTDANTVIYGPAPTLEKESVRKLAVGCVVTVVLMLIRMIAAPLVREYQMRTLSIGFTVLIRALLDPLIWFAAGWSLMLMLTMALKKGPLKHRSVPYIRRILAVILVLWLMVSILFIGSFALDDHLYTHHLRGEWVDEPYESDGQTVIGKHWQRIPLPTVKWLEWIGIPITQFNFLYPWALSLLGAALCLCGFPDHRAK